MPSELGRWLKERGGEAGTGLLFVRTDRAAASLELAPIARDTVNDAVNRCVKLIGLDPADGGRALAARRHNHRGGRRRSAGLRSCSGQGHKSVEALKRYIRHADYSKLLRDCSLGSETIWPGS